MICSPVNLASGFATSSFEMKSLAPEEIDYQNYDQISCPFGRYLYSRADSPIGELQD